MGQHDQPDTQPDTADIELCWFCGAENESGGLCGFCCHRLDEID
jgi:hypothetical protein